MNSKGQEVNVVNVILMLATVVFLFIGSPYTSDATTEPLDNLDKIVTNIHSVRIPISSSTDRDLINHEITDLVTQQLLENDMKDYHLEGVEIPNDLPDSGLGKVDLVFYQGIVEIPIVKTLTIDIVNLSYKEVERQFELSEIQENPSLIVEKVNVSDYSKESYVFRWVDKQGKDIRQEELMTAFANQDDWYLLTEKIEDEANFFVEAVTHEQLASYLSEKEKLDMVEKSDFQASVMANTTIKAEYQLPIILRNDLQNTKNKAEVEALVNKTLQPKFNKVESKKKTYDNYTMEDVSEVLNKDTLSGTVVPVTYTVDVEGETVEMPPVDVTVLPEGVIEDLDDWEDIPVHPTDRSRWLLENPINETKAGFPHRGLELEWERRDSRLSQQYGFHVVDELKPLQRSSEKTYAYNDDLTTFIPYENNKAAYTSKYSSSNNIRGLGWGKSSNPEMAITSQFFLRDKKGQEGNPSKLKQIFVEKNKSFVFVIDMTLKRNLNYEMMMSTYNVAEHRRDIAMLELLDTDYYDDRVPMYVYGNNRGFYMEPYTKKRLTMVLKNKKGEWLSDYTMMAPGALNALYRPKDSPYADSYLSQRNAFGNGFSNPGIERHTTLENGTPIMTKEDTAYQFGAPYKSLDNDEKITVGYEIFVGQEIPTSTLMLTNDSWTGYHDDRPDMMEIPYTLTDIPKGSTKGYFYSTDQDGNEIEVGSYDVPKGEETVKGTLMLNLNELMSNINLSDGDIDIHSIPITTLTETNGIPDTIASDEEIILITSYAFGAQVKGQTVNKGSTWKDKPEDLLVNKAVLPGNEATYEYVENPPINTQKTGLHWVKVKMSDVTVGKTKTYDVPVSVVNGNLPKRGIHLAAKDVTTKTAGIKGLTDRELNNYLLKESQAIAWENETGSLDGISKRITSKTVNPESKSGDYEAVILAEKGNEKTEKTIKVTVLPDIDIQASSENMPKSIDLGTDSRNFKDPKELKKWVTVTTEGKPVTDYDVSLVELDTSRINEAKTDNGKLSVTAEGKETIVPISIPIVWGNSVAIGGSNTMLMNRESTLALSIHDDQTGKYLSMSYGNLSNNQKDIPFDAQIGNQPFMQVTHYSTESWSSGEEHALEVFDGPNEANQVTYSINGNDKPTQEIINGFGTKGRLEIEEGDVIRLYTKDAYHKVLYTDSDGPFKPIQGLPKDRTTFGVLKETGFHPTYVAHLKTEGSVIPVEHTRDYSTYDDYLEENWLKFISIPEEVPKDIYNGIKPAGYKSYPELNLGVGEESIGEVFAIQETTVNKQYIKYAYPITIVGGGPELALTGIPEVINFGTPVIKSKEQVLKQVKKNDKWGFQVEDNREDMKRQSWAIQMKSEPFKTGVHTNYRPLKGSVLAVQSNNTRVDLNTEFQRVYTKEKPEKGLNQVIWESDDGFYLTIPPGYIEAESEYTSTVDILLSNVPDMSQP